MNSENVCDVQQRNPRLAVTAVALVAAMGALGAVTVWGRSGDTGALLGLDIAVAALSCLLAPSVLWRPVAGTVVLTLLAALSPAATPAATFGALHTAQHRRFTVAVAVGVTGVAAHAAQGLWRPVSGITYVWWLPLITLGYAALVGWGALSQARWALLASLRERARRAEAEQGRRVAEARMMERTRIAREMHDVLAHRLSLLATYAGALEYRPDASPDKLAQAAGVIRTGVHQALDELREVILVLRDEDAAADDDRPQPVLTDLPALVAESRDAGGLVQLTDEVVEASALPAAAGRTAYRVVQEGLTNARKHAAGRPVRVAIEGRPGTRLVIEIRNPVPPDGAVPLAPGTGTGLVGLTERVQLAGGRLDHEVAAGEFRLRAWLPWPA